MNVKRIRSTILIFASLATIILAFAACQEEYIHEEIIDDEINDDPVIKSGELVIRLTDAPFPTDLVAEANIEINKVAIYAKDNQEENKGITVSEEVQSYNLLDLTNGVTAILADTAIDAGLYNEIRLYINSANVILTDSTFYDLKIPSGAQSGLKIKINPAVAIDSTSSQEILLDLDVSKSFVVQGNPKTPAGIKGFIFKPVIKATTPSTTGILKGTVSNEEDNPVEGTQVSVFVADTLYTTSFTEANGDYKIMGIEAGIIDVEFEKNGYKITRDEDIEITVKNTTVLNAVLTAKE